MTTPAVLDDYLQDLLGDVGIAPAPVAEAPPAVVVEPAPVAEAEVVEAPVIAPDVPAAPSAPVLAVAPVRAGAEADLITDDEFEALLDQLHGDGVPQAPAAPAATPVQTPAPALAIAPSRAPASEAISDDEFEALLDELHGGAAPTARVPSPAPVAEPPSAPVAPAAPAIQRALPPLPTHPYLQTPVDTGQRRRATERKTRWLRLRCDQQHYALELLKVQEVVLPAILLPLRGAAPHMLGVMNLRGQVVPVIDLGLYLGRRAIEPDATTRIVVLEEHGEILGLRVSAVEDVANLSDHQIESPDNARVGRIANPLFRGVARLNERAVILLDASQLLT
ncbi:MULTISPECIES: chemotaxis protein CheW [unclassified Pseudoxanthomonas]|uniref:chemotaxis protein CheW n=1 Tax=unclassified Pseudoxanthomonas TaxID=2645906 RepID=UPI0008E909EB|nr:MULTISPECIES: chemotaxis protein CheW [unclassified Pseudoxanthomonas]PPJ40862.1 chemotaxis protein CheW [Pseudoxanthomonas sp. KAs_5_3]SFV26089.1 purine-binding chemotaxis protein CheW [Pseudoxanthomonas sp. YR558]